MTDTTTPAVEQTAPAHETPTTEADTANNQPTGEKAKLREQVDNLNKALKEARAETAKYRAAEEEKNRKEAEAKGEYEKVSQADQAKIAELTANVESLSGKSSAYEAIIQKQVDASVSTMSDAQKSIYEQLSVHLDLTGKLELIPKILEVAKGQPHGQNPTGGKSDADLSKRAELDSAVKNNDFHSGFNAIFGGK